MKKILRCFTFEKTGFFYEKVIVPNISNAAKFVLILVLAYLFKSFIKSEIFNFNF